MTEDKRVKINENGMTFKQVMTEYISWWPLFVVTFLVFFSIAGIYCYYTIPVFESKATIQIKDEKKGGDDSKILASFDFFSSNKIVENEVEVLHSRSLMKEVVKRFSLYAPITSAEKVHDQSAYIFSPVIIQLKDPDHFVADSKVYFDMKYYQGTKWVRLDKKLYPLNVWINSKWGDIRFIPNSRYDESFVGKGQLFFSLIPVVNVTDQLLINLKVAPVGKLSTIVNLTLKDQVPERGEDILNGLINEYNLAAVKYKNSLATNALSFVDERLRYVVYELDSVERAIQHYKTSRGVVDISEQGKLFLTSVESNDKQISEINGQLAIIDQIERSVKTNDPNSGVTPSAVGLKDDALSELLAKLYDADLEYEKLKRTTAENNQILISLNNQIDKLKQNILENIQNQRSNLQVSKRNLDETSIRYSSVLQSIPEKERQLLDITRQQIIKNNIYTFLLQKREEAALSFSSSVADSRLIDDAHSGSTPVSPNKPTILAIAFLFSIGIPIGIVSLKRMVSNTIQFKSDIQSACSFPTIGEINFHQSKKPFVLFNNEGGFEAEQIRQITTSLSYLNIKAGETKILISSIASGEGKTFVAMNLAVSLALIEKKVALVDLDLRKPGLSKLMNIKYTIGVSDYLKRNAEEEQVIYKTEIHNLYFIPAGDIPTYPFELISNGRIEELFVYLQKKFDYIIIDTAPMNPFPDAYVVSKLCNATLLIVRQHLTSKAGLEHLQNNQEIRRLNNVAIIFNGIKSFLSRKSNYKSVYQ